MDDMETAIANVIEEHKLYTGASKKYLFVKRLLDVALSLIFIVVLSPLLFLTAALIRIDSPGPVIFSQCRCGLKGRLFRMYKFRSMVVSGETLMDGLIDKNDVSGPMFKMKADPRVTKVGRIIRKTSIDELPQLINVLKGDMSLVGPRPPLIKEVARYSPCHYLRLSVKPGMTGLWQATGRNAVDFDEMVRLDLKYIKERSLWTDLKIITKTIPLLFGDKRAF